MPTLTPLLLRRSVWAVACACLLLTASSLRAAKITLETRTVTLPDGSSAEYELGTLHVPENRGDPASRTIKVGFARFKAIAPTGAPPTFHLPGGPGGSYVKSLNLTKADPAARKLNERQAADLKLYRQIGDVVYVDQRGCSDLGDNLAYAYDIPAKSLDQPGRMARETAEYVVAAKAAVADHQKKGIDLRGYTVLECAADVNDVRRELGYERITLIGQSFGSQWSFAIMRLHPAIVARAVLSGVEPIDCGYDMPSHIYASMRRQWQAVEREAAFKPYLPAGGIAGAVSEIVRRLERGPFEVKTTDKSGKAVTITLGRDDWQPGNPAAILAVYHGHYDAWAKSVVAKRQARKGRIDPLIGLLIDTSLAVTPERRNLLRTDPAIAVLGEWNFDDYMATEDIWPSADVGDAFRNEVLNRTPVLFVQGDWDTSTPMENLLHVQPYFVNSRTILVHQGSHGAYAAVRAQLPEATAAIMDFVRNGATENLPSLVTVTAPKFAAPDFPVPAKL
ncbi:MAG: alpha/beta hydrolase [Opitutaceae bacterium]|nr:alpha/beta hydrolase [Opitutaceae bacterium]